MAYNLLSNFHLIVDGDMSLTSITSAVVEIKNQDNVGVQVQWTGTPVGTFAVQISLDHNQDINGNVLVAGTWVTLPVSSTITAAGSADNGFYYLNQLPAPYLRIVYTKGSSTGVLNAYVCSKGV